MRLLPKERTRPWEIRNHRRQKTTLALPPSPPPPTMKLPSFLRPVQSERNEDGELLTPRTKTANVVLVVRLLLGGGRFLLERSSLTCPFPSSFLCSLPQFSISLLMIVNVMAQSAVNIALPLVLLPWCRTARREKNCQFRFPARSTDLALLAFLALPQLGSRRSLNPYRPVRMDRQFDDARHGKSQLQRELPPASLRWDKPLSPPFVPRVRILPLLTCASLPQGCLILPAGRLADIFGARRSASVVFSSRLAVTRVDRSLLLLVRHKSVPRRDHSLHHLRQLSPYAA